MKPTRGRANTKTKRKIEKIKRKKYSDKSLQQALKEIENGMPKKQAAQIFQVPRATLQFRIKHPDHKSLPGPNTILSIEEENKIKQWLINCSKKGFPKRKEDIVHSVMEFLKENNRPNPFKDNVPGEKWFKLFLKRHPDIAIRTPEAVTSASAVVSEKDINHWFHEIEMYLREQNLFEILSDPTRVLNGDETNFLLCAKTGVVLAPKGAKNVYEVDHAQAKTSLTVMFTFRASGELTPPMVIFPYKRLPAEISSKIPPDWGIGLSDNGWMKTEIFCSYIEKILYPYLVKTETVFPVILFVDGHKTHLTYAVSEICSSLNIVLIALYPNCTRLLQPADVSAFRPLKGGWQKTVLEWRRENPAQALTKQKFIPLLEKTIERSIKAETIVNGFRTTGLFPWNSEAIDYTKCLGKKHKKNYDVNLSEVENGKLMTKQDFISIVGNTVIEMMESEKKLTDTHLILKQLWHFFSATEKESVGTEITLENVEDSMAQNISKSNMNLVEIYQKSNDECYAAKKPSEKTQERSVHELEDMDIESMNVVIYEEPDTLDSYIPISHEVLIEEVSFPPTEDSIATIKTLNNKDTELKFQESNKESQYDSQNIHSVQVIHHAQIETYKDKNDSTNIKTRENSTEERITNIADIHPNNQDYDKIEVLSVERNFELTTPVKVNSIKRVHLDDILKNPKTPKRKGIKNVKRTSFIITSTDVKEEQLKKLKEKEEKEKNIRKRKEEREKKKLLLEKTKQIKKQSKVDNKKEKVTKKKTDNVQVVSEKTPDDVKKILFSEDFTNLNLDISLKAKQSDTNLESIDEGIIENEDNCQYIEKNKGKYISKYDKKVEPEITKLIDNLKENIKVKEHPNTQLKPISRENYYKNELKKILYSQELIDAKEDNEEAPDTKSRPAQKFSLFEIEKMLSD